MDNRSPKSRVPSPRIAAGCNGGKGWLCSSMKAASRNLPKRSPRRLQVAGRPRIRIADADQRTCRITLHRECGCWKPDGELLLEGGIIGNSAFPTQTFVTPAVMKIGDTAHSLVQDELFAPILNIETFAGPGGSCEPRQCNKIRSFGIGLYSKGSGPARPRRARSRHLAPSG